METQKKKRTSNLVILVGQPDSQVFGEDRVFVGIFRNTWFQIHQFNNDTRSIGSGNYEGVLDSKHTDHLARKIRREDYVVVNNQDELEAILQKTYKEIKPNNLKILDTYDHVVQFYKDMDGKPYDNLLGLTSKEYQPSGIRYVEGVRQYV